MNVYAVFYELVPLLSFIFSIFLISLVLRSDWRSGRNRVFALLLLVMGLWGFTVFGVRTSPHPDGAGLARLWEQAVLALVLGSAVLFYHFTLLYTRVKAPARLLPALYLFWAGFVGLTVAGLTITGMEQVTLSGGYLGWVPRFTRLGWAYLAAGYLPAGLALYNLMQVYRNHRSPEEKNRMLYMVVGGTLSLVGATCEFLFPQSAIFYPFGIMANLYFVALTSVAMLKYQLLELRMVLRSGITYTLLGIFIVGIYGAVFALFNFAFQSQSDSSRLLSAISAAAVVAIALQPALNQLQTWVDRWFYRERYDHLQALRQFSQETRDITDLDSLSQSLTGLVRRAMTASSASLLLPNHQTSRFYVSSTSGRKAKEGESGLRSDCPALLWLQENEGILTRNDLEIVPRFRALTVADWRVINTLETELLIPLKLKGELTGVLVVGAKLSQEGYSTNDINLLQTVVNQTATAIENARLYAREMGRLAEVEQLEKLKQTLLLTVSHELKTPLTTIKAGTEMLAMQEDASASDAQQRLLRSINRGVERLERLVEESLDYARMQDSNLELDLQPTDLRELYEETVGIMLPAARAKKQVVELNLPEAVPAVLVDRRRCERVLLNLISNANRYTQPGGRISVGVQVEPTYLVTSVIDTGQGMPEDELDKIFNVYYRNATADGRGAGLSSGLGLAIAKYLVELHGGRIWVDSQVGVGSSFHYSLPLGARYESLGNRR